MKPNQDWIKNRDYEINFKKNQCVYSFKQYDPQMS